MALYVTVSIIAGVLFGVMDAFINANPVARRLYEVFKPIARSSVNPLAGLAIDLFYGFAMAAIFMLLFWALPGESAVVKGISFALLTWFFRVVMNAASWWMMFRIPGKTLLYSVATGLGEMLVLGLLFGLTLKPMI